MSGFRKAILVFLFASVFSFAGCGGSSSSPDTGGTPAVSAGAVITTALSITQLNPAPGTYSEVPPQIQVSFSELAVSPSAAATASNWALSCPTGTFYPAAVIFNPATGVATLDMPSSVDSSGNTAALNGATCTLNVSPGIVDTVGNPLSGTMSFGYTVVAGGASPALPYSPQNNPFSSTMMTSLSFFWNLTSFTEYAPGFQSQGTAANSYSLVGFNLRTGNYIDQLQPVWATDYGAATANQISGDTYGGNGGSPASLMCPATGNSRVVGVFGTTDGSELDRLGLICQAQDGSSTTTTTTASLGGSGGTHFTLQCPQGSFVVAIGGYQGSFVSALELGCQ